MSSFDEDKLAKEKNEPIESSSLKFVNVPLTLLAVFFGFGVTYLALRTDKVTMTEGDSRTHAPVEKNQPTAGGADVLGHGKQIFTTTCQACHQASGEGIAGTFPPLVGSEWVTGPENRMAAIVLYGINGEIAVKGQKYHGVMPSFKDQFKPEDIAAVMTYVRQTFGKTADTVEPSVVEKVKGDMKEKGPWAGEADLNAQKWE